MARIRNIKPDFFLDEQLCELSPLARLAFAGLWCQADREGRLEDRPRKLKVVILPFDECNMDTILTELAKSGHIARYSAAGRDVIQIRKFSKHQWPHPKEPPSELPREPQRAESQERRTESHTPHARNPGPTRQTTVTTVNDTGNVKTGSEQGLPISSPSDLGSGDQILGVGDGIFNAREDRVKDRREESQAGHPEPAPLALEGSDPNGFLALAAAARPSATNEAPAAGQPPDPTSLNPGPGIASFVPMHPHELEQAIRVAVEKLHPDLGFWRAGRFSTRDVLAFIPAVATEEAQKAARAVILRRVQLFAESSDPWIVKEGWSVRAFVDRWASLEPIAVARQPARPPSQKETEKDRLAREARDHKLWQRDQKRIAEREAARAKGKA